LQGNDFCGILIHLADLASQTEVQPDPMFAFLIMAGYVRKAAPSYLVEEM